MRFFLSKTKEGRRRNLWAHWSNQEGIFFSGSTDMIECSVQTVEKLSANPEVEEVNFDAAKNELLNTDFEHGVMTLTVAATRN